MSWRDHISVDPNILVGKPCIKGTRISVELIVEHMGRGYTMADLITNYPWITEDDIRACLMYAAKSVPFRSVKAKQSA